MRILPTLTLLLCVFASFAQTGSFYDSNGFLLADTTKRISPNQSRNFAYVEAELLECINKDLVYPMPLWRMEIEMKVIVSFSVDPNGFLNDFRFENPIGSNAERLASQYLLKKLVDCNFRYKGFSGSSYKSDIYFLPFSFNLKNGKTPVIENGWIQVPTPDI